MKGYVPPAYDDEQGPSLDVNWSLTFMTLNQPIELRLFPQWTSLQPIIVDNMKKDDEKQNQSPSQLNGYLNMAYNKMYASFNYLNVEENRCLSDL